MFFRALSIVVVLASVALGQVSYPSVITEEIVNSLNQNGKADIIVELKAGVSKAQASIQNLKFATRGAKITTLREALIENAAESQKSVLAILEESFGVDAENVQTFWISNVVLATGVSKDVILKLAGLAEVAVIRPPVDVPLDGVVTGKRVIEPQQQQTQWGVSITKADQVWDYGVQGEGIVVASVDTGVRVTHRILRENYRGDYGWLDPETRSTSPRDFDGHGTHTMGTIAGHEGYGIAPGVKWIACLACSSSCSESSLLACGQFVFCPTNTNGQQPNCTMAPHIVSNSWGSSNGDQYYYDQVISNYHQAGIIPIFSAGNGGPRCGSVGSPGDRDVIAVGATDINDGWARFSSTGPTSDGRLKPEISAPGVDVLSAYIDGDNSFATYSGTSMACPHVAGVVALLLQQNPGMTYEEVRMGLFENAQTEGLSSYDLHCGGQDDGFFPNFGFGYGRVDALASFLYNGNSTATL